MTTTLKHMTIPQAAKILGLSAGTVRTMVYAGELPAYTFSKYVRIESSELEDFINRSRINGNSATDNKEI